MGGEGVRGVEPSHAVSGRVKLCSHLGGDLAMPYKSGGRTQLILLLGADQGQGPELVLKGPARKYLRLHGPTVVVAPA